MDIFRLGFVELIEDEVDLLKEFFKDVAGRVSDILEDIKVFRSGELKGLVTRESYEEIKEEIRALLYDSVDDIEDNLKESIRRVFRDIMEKSYEDINVYLPGTAMDEREENAIEKLEEEYKGNTFRGRIVKAINRVMIDIEKDILHHRNEVIFERVIKRLVRRKVLFGGISLYTWIHKLFIGEVGRLLSEERVDMWKQLGIKRFRSRLSSMHSIMARKYGWEPGTEICEVKARGKYYTFEQIKKLHPIHPFCSCWAEPIYPKPVRVTD